MLKIYSPYKGTCWTNQYFGQNANTYYSEGGLRGHTGIDFGQKFLAPLFASTDSYCYSVQNKDNKDLMRYRAVYTLIEDAGVWYELSYGHLIDIYATPKTFLKRGDPIGTEGNTGNVASGGKKVTATEKKNGSGKGSHLHLQLRLVKPVDVKEKGKKYLSDSKGLLKYLDKFWEVPNYENGYAGCVDPAPYWVNPPKDLISQTLRYGMRGEQVKILQKKLGIETDGIFGLQTELAVKAFQKKHKLTADGIVGKKTSEVLNT